MNFTFNTIPRWTCAMCNTQCSSESAFRLHHKSTKHQTNLMAYELKTALSPSPFTLYSHIDASKDSDKVFTYHFK